MDGSFRSCALPESSGLSRAASRQSLCFTPMEQVGRSTLHRGATPISQERASSSRPLQLNGTQQSSQDRRDSNLYRFPSMQTLPSASFQEQGHGSTLYRNATFTSQERAPSTKRDQLEEQLKNYIFDTLTYFKTVRNFLAAERSWTQQRQLELEKMRAMESNQANVKRKYLEKEMETVLRNTLAGLDQLHIFLDAVKKLAVTSLFIFTNESCLLEGVDTEAVQSLIVKASIVCPILIVFERDAHGFFLPIFNNIEVLIEQLAKYIRRTKELCETLNKPLQRDQLGTTGTKQITADHVRKLSKIRKDESFQLMYLFGDENAHTFIDIYTECESEMDFFLSGLEKAAAKLSDLKTGSRISSVTGCTVGVIGGALAIAGLALAPVTLGTSLALTFAGVGIGVASGATGVATGIAKMVVRRKQGEKANYIFQNFMVDVEKVLNCLNQIAGSLPPHVSRGNMLVRTGAVLAGAAGVGIGIKGLASGKRAVGAAAGNAAIFRALPKAVGVLGFAVNILFIGLDLVTIIRESRKLAKGKKSKDAQRIYSRTALWRSEKDGWDKIYYTLVEEVGTFQSKLKILQQPVHY